jgi:ribosomal protein S18 acetylase RimI-like enzyme
MPPFDVSRAAAHELLPACRLLFAEGRAERCRDRILGDTHASGLFVARNPTGRLCAASLVQVLPGALGVAWVPRGESPAAVAAATAAARVWLVAQGVKVCQAFATGDEAADARVLEHCGFRHTTQLLFLKHALASAHWPRKQLSFTAELPPVSAAFAESLLATHADTLDCPELNADRTPAEILAGFIPAPTAEWYLAERGNDPVGVVMLEFARDFESADLTYLGVVPSARRCGLGAELVTFAIGQAALARLSALNVAVDARNAPAVKLYTRHGFTEYERRDVWLAQLRG